MNNLDMKKFKEMSPCKEGYEFVLNLKTTDLKIIFDALKEHNLEWANWLVARLLAHKDRIRYAVFAAEQVLDIFEKSHPGDLRPRQAIEAAIVCIEKHTDDNRAYAARSAESAAISAADAAWSAESAESAADAAAYAAARSAWSAKSVTYAARSAESAAISAADAAWSAESAESAAISAAYAAAYAAARSADAAYARQAMKARIVNYGLQLLGIERMESKR